MTRPADRISFFLDCFLMVSGLVLACTAWFRVDVALARYPLLAMGAFLAAAGISFRIRARQRYRRTRRGHD